MLRTARADGLVRIGDFATIETAMGYKKAYFLGRRADTLTFLSADTSEQLFTVTLLPDAPSGAIFESVVESVEQDAPICSPLSVLACLRRLEASGALPSALQARLAGNPHELLEEMIGRFGRVAMLKGRAPVPPRVWIDYRGLQHERIVQFLSLYGMSVELTTSVGKLFRHLRRGMPAVLSAHVTQTRTAIMDIEDTRTTLPLFDPALTYARLPVPRWAPSNMGAHAVAGLSVIPSPTYFDPGGRRILVLDSANNRVNVWPSVLTRLSTPRFVLIYPYSAERVENSTPRVTWFGY